MAQHAIAISACLWLDIGLSHVKRTPVATSCDILSLWVTKKSGTVAVSAAYTDKLKCLLGDVWGHDHFPIKTVQKIAGNCERIVTVIPVLRIEVRPFHTLITLVSLNGWEFILHARLSHSLLLKL